MNVKMNKKFIFLIPFFLFFSFIFIALAQAAVIITIDESAAGNVLTQNVNIFTNGTADTNATTACTGSQVLFGNGSCGIVAGTGDITGVAGDQYITNGTGSGDVNLIFNETLLNDTIDDRAVAGANETNRFQNLTTYTCQGTDKVTGVFDNGTVTCGTDSTGATVNIFDQTLNTTSNVSFGNVSLVNDGWFNGFFNWTLDIFADLYFDFDGAVLSFSETQLNSTIDDRLIANETNRFQNLTTYDCGAGFVVNGVFDNGTISCVADADTGATNIFNQSLNTTDFVIFAQVNSTNWNNVSITQSQISDLVHTTDTNETNRFQNLTTYNCQGSNKATGVLLNGTINCSADISAGITNIFDQTLNTTSNVSFGNVSSSSWFNGLFNWIINVGNVSTAYLTFNGSTLFFNEAKLNETISDLDTDTTIANETNRFQNLTSYACQGTDKVVSVANNGTVTCGTDTQGAGNLSWNETRYKRIFQGDFDLNITILELLSSTQLNNTYRNLSGTINEANISDLTHIANETNRFQNLTTYDCQGTNVMSGVLLNGTINCTAQTGGTNTWENNLTTGVSADLNPIGDLVQSLGALATEWLNIFAGGGFFGQVNATEGNFTTLRIAGTAVVAGAHTTDTNETQRFQNLTSYNCQGSNKAAGILFNGTINCSADLNTGASNVFDQDLNTTNNVTFREFNITNATGILGLFQGTNANVGIGTNVPDEVLEIAGSNIKLHMDSTNHAYLLLDRSGTTSVGAVQYQTAGSTIFEVGMDNSATFPDYYVGDSGMANKWMTVTTAGDVGIGTSTPPNLLSLLDSTSGANLSLKLSSSSIVGEETLGSINFGGIETGGGGAENNASAFIRAIADLGWTGLADTPTKLTFWTTPDGTGTATEKMTILENGSVGIGTSSPTHFFSAYLGTGTTILNITNSSGTGIFNNETCIIIKGRSSTANIC